MGSSKPLYKTHARWYQSLSRSINHKFQTKLVAAVFRKSSLDRTDSWIQLPQNQFLPFAWIPIDNCANQYTYSASLRFATQDRSRAQGTWSLKHFWCHHQEESATGKDHLCLPAYKITTIRALVLCDSFKEMSKDSRHSKSVAPLCTNMMQSCSPCSRRKNRADSAPSIVSLRPEKSSYFDYFP